MDNELSSMETRDFKLQDNCLEQVRKVLAAALRIPPERITPDTQLAELGMDSHDRITLLFEIESEFDIMVPNEVGDIRTVGELAEGVARLLAEQKPSSNTEKM